MSHPFPTFRLFLFDLDGTLIDSREDIALAVNLVLDRMKRPPLPGERVIEFVGEGMTKLMERALREIDGREAKAGELKTAVSLMMQEYSRHLLDSTRLYPGVREILGALGKAKAGVVTNKPEAFARRILEAFDLAERFCVIMGGDSPAGRKPDPGPLLEAMKECGASAAETMMIGDSPTDIDAGKAAGAATCGYAGGFRPLGDLEQAGSDFIIRRLSELGRFL